MHLRYLRLTACAALFALACTSPLDLPAAPGRAFLAGRVVVAVPGTDRVAPVSGAILSVPLTNLSAVSDADGRFRLGPVQPSKIPVNAKAVVEGVEKQRLVAPVELDAGIRELGDVLLRDNAELAGSARLGELEHGNAGTLVFVPRTEFLAVATDDGSWLIRGLPEGTVQVAATRTGYDPVQSGDIPLEGGKRAIASALVLKPSPPGAPTTGSLSGEVAVDGTSPEGVAVSLERVYSPGAPMGPALVDKDGHFQLKEIPLGLWRVRVSKEGYADAVVPNVLVVGGTTVLDKVTLYPGLPAATDGGTPEACDGGGCGACATNDDCSAPAVCVAGTCRSCVQRSDCGGGLACVAGTCRGCENDGECGFGALCEDHSCIPGTCRKASDCPDEGEACVDRFCTPGCDDSSECRDGRVCADGRCVPGGCLAASDCPEGLVCVAGTHVCGGCVADAECGSGKLCFAGACLTGNCRDGLDCAEQVCRLATRTCERCLSSAECGAGRVCDDGACVAGSCAVNADCSGGAVCRAHVCAPCAADAECGSGLVCESGACVVGSCHVDADCPSPKACVKNACVGDCRSNADCGQFFCSSLKLCGACDQDAQCGSGRVCVGGACVSGTCHGDYDCASGENCGVDHTCVRVAPTVEARSTLVHAGAQGNPLPIVGKQAIYVLAGTPTGYRPTALDPTTLATLWQAREIPAGKPEAGLALPARSYVPGEELLVVPGVDAKTNAPGVVAYVGKTGEQAWFVASAQVSALTAGLVDGAPAVAWANADKLNVRLGNGSAVLDSFAMPCAPLAAPVFGTGSIYAVCSDRLVALDPKTGVTKWALVHTPGTGGTATTLNAGTVTPIALWRPREALVDTVVYGGVRAGDTKPVLFAVDAGASPTRRYMVVVAGLDGAKAAPLLDSSGTAHLFTAAGAFSRVDLTGQLLSNGATSGLASSYEALADDGSLVGFSGTPALLTSLSFDAAGAPKVKWRLDAQGGSYPALTWPVWTSAGDLLVWSQPIGATAPNLSRLRPVSGGASRPAAPAWAARGGNPENQSRAPAYECVADDACTAPASCVLGTCAGSCRAASECPAGKACILGTCGNCVSDFSCRTGEICSMGVCRSCTPGGSTRCCHDASECNGGESCVAGSCIAGPSRSALFPAFSTKQPIMGSDGSVAEVYSASGQWNVRRYNQDGTAPWTTDASTGISDFYAYQQDIYATQLPGKSYPTMFFQYASSAYDLTVVRVDAAPGAPVVTRYNNGFPPVMAFAFGRNGAKENMYAMVPGSLFWAWDADTYARQWETTPPCVYNRVVTGSDGTVYGVCQGGMVVAYDPAGDPDPSHKNSDGTRWAKELWRTTDRGFTSHSDHIGLSRPNGTGPETLYFFAARTVNGASALSLVMQGVGAAGAGAYREVNGVTSTERFVIGPDGWLYAPLPNGNLEIVGPDGSLKLQAIPASANPGVPSLSDDGVLYFAGPTQLEAWQVTPTHDFVRLFGLDAPNGGSYAGSTTFLAAGPKLVASAVIGGAGYWVVTDLRTGTGPAKSPAWPMYNGDGVRSRMAP